MEEKIAHRIAAPTIEIVGERKSLVFASSLAHAERLTEIFNRHKDGCARWVHGGTPKEVRAEIFKDYAEEKFQFLTNVAVATEGFDDPSIQVVVQARPTKSRSLYAQMVGRGTRTIPGIVDRYESPEDRKMAIAESRKPVCLVLDFVGNTGKHKLMTTADILGGNYSEEVIERAKQTITKEGKSADTIEQLKQAAAEIHAEAEAKKAETAKKRNFIQVGAKFTTRTISAFDVLGIEPARTRGWHNGKELTDKQRGIIEKHLPDAANLPFLQHAQDLRLGAG